MNLLKSLFGKKEKQSVEPMRGGPVIQSKDEQDATRGRMESEMAGQRAKREVSEGASEEPSKD